MEVIDLGTLSYRDAWGRQELAHADVLAGGPARIFLVEHPPVITLGRRPGQERHLLASPDQLTARGVDCVESDRGGDVTFHGTGQLVCYPILKLADHKLSVSGYVHLLENVVVDVLAEFGLASCADPAAVGVWTTTDRPAKVCAIGVRIRRGVTLHGLALNVSTDLDFFNLIVPCGLAGRPVTSLARQLGARCPAMADVKRVLVRSLIGRLGKSETRNQKPEGSPKSEIQNGGGDLPDERHSGSSR